MSLVANMDNSPCLSGSSELNRMSGSSNQRFSSYAATLYEHCEAETRDAWNRLRGEGLKHVPGWRESAKNVITNSCTLASNIPKLLGLMSSDIRDERFLAFRSVGMGVPLHELAS